MRSSLRRSSRSDRRLSSRFYPLGSDILVQAESIQRIDPPDEPYLTP